MAANLQSIYQTYCAPGELSSFSTQGFSWASSGNGEGGGYSQAVTPNQRNCWGSNQDSVSPNAANGNQNQYGSMICAKSNRPGGVNVGLLDGSVRFIKNTVNAGTYAALGTKAGSEVISADSY